MVLQPDGKIVAAGEADRRDCTWYTNYLVARLNPDGSPDFSVSDGMYQDYMQASGVALQPDGKIVSNVY